MSMVQYVLLFWFQRLCKTDLERSPLQKYFCIWYSNMIINFKFSILVIMFDTKVNIGLCFDISWFHFYCFMTMSWNNKNGIILCQNKDLYWLWYHFLISQHQCFDKYFSNKMLSFIVCWINRNFIQSWLH